MMSSVIVKKESNNVGRGVTYRQGNNKRKNHQWQAPQQPEHVELRTKRRKTEQDYLEEQNYNILERAKASKLRGDDSMCHFHLQQLSQYSSKLMPETRRLMVRDRERDREMKLTKKFFNQSMESAKWHALQGNSSRTRFSLEEALNHAQEAVTLGESTLMSEYRRQAPTIQRSLRRRIHDNSHLEEMECSLARAHNHALQGDKYMMEDCLRQFEDAATKVSKQSSDITEALWKRHHKIRSLPSLREVSYNHHLSQAKAWAERGDHSSVDYHLSKAKYFGVQIHLPAYQVEKAWREIREIRNSLIKGVPKKEKKEGSYTSLQMPTGIPPPLRQSYGLRNATVPPIGMPAPIPKPRCWGSGLRYATVSPIRLPVPIPKPPSHCWGSGLRYASIPPLEMPTPIPNPHCRGSGLYYASITPQYNKLKNNQTGGSSSEVILEKEVSLDDRLAQQLQNEEKAGRVIHLD